jgi:hypothetical protein
MSPLQLILSDIQLPAGWVLIFRGKRMMSSVFYSDFIASLPGFSFHPAKRQDYVPDWLLRLSVRPFIAMRNSALQDYK